jgi:hypothetical protein
MSDERPFFTIGQHSFERNTGYKDTAYALSEIVDNSVEEEARNVTIIVKEQRTPRKILSIGVLDNGDGMSPDIIQLAICQGSGTRFHGQSTRSRKFGRYGIGLPKGSISQCKKFTVWSWQDGNAKGAFKNGIDIEDDDWIKAGAKIAFSVADPMPRDWFAVSGHGDSKSGTFVLWEKCDRLTWKTAIRGKSGLIPNLRFLLGRIYRKFLKTNSPKQVSLNIVVCDENMRKVNDYSVLPNDPLYLTPDTCIPEPDYLDGWKKGTPLFEKVSDSEIEIKYQTIKDGFPTNKVAKVVLSSSEASKEARIRFNGIHAGNQPHGKHCAKNLGVSILREGREITLANNWNTEEKRDRFWGLELDFPAELDEFLGISNNKQSADTFQQISHLTPEDVREDGESTSKVLQRIAEDDPNRSALFKFCWEVSSSVKNLRSLVTSYTPPSQGTTLSDDGQQSVVEIHETAEGAAEQAATKSDNNSEVVNRSPETQKEITSGIKKILGEEGVPEAAIDEIIERLIARGSQYLIQKKSGLGSPFFTVQRVVDAKIIGLNTDHPAYSNLLDTLECNEVDDLETALKHMEKAKVTLILMLEAWAKLESEASEDEREGLIVARESWGRYLRKFVNEYNKNEE